MTSDLPAHQFYSRPLHFHASTLVSFHPRASVTELYIWYTDRRWQCSVAEKDTVGLAENASSSLPSIGFMTTGSKLLHELHYQAFGLVVNTCIPPPSVWPHLFCGVGHEKRRGEQLQWSLAFRLYIGSLPCAQLPGPVHTARLGQVCFYI